MVFTWPAGANGKDKEGKKLGSRTGSFNTLRCWWIKAQKLRAPWSSQNAPSVMLQLSCEVQDSADYTATLLRGELGTLRFALYLALLLQTWSLPQPCMMCGSCSLHRHSSRASCALVVSREEALLVQLSFFCEATQAVLAPSVSHHSHSGTMCNLPALRRAPMLLASATPSLWHLPSASLLRPVLTQSPGLDEFLGA